MPPELHLHPDRLHDHGRCATGLAEELHAALRGAPRGFDADRLRGVVEVAAGELAELGAVLRRAGAAGTAADAEASARFVRLLETW